MPPPQALAGEQGKMAGCGIRAAQTQHGISMKHYDYIVIGGGSGGIASANRAAMHDTVRRPCGGADREREYGT